jgi:hypothetical protein
MQTQTRHIPPGHQRAAPALSDLACAQKAWMPFRPYEMAPEQKALLIFTGEINPHQTRQAVYARMAVNLERYGMPNVQSVPFMSSLPVSVARAPQNNLVRCTTVSSFQRFDPHESSRSRSAPRFGHMGYWYTVAGLRGGIPSPAEMFTSTEIKQALGSRNP